MENKQTKYKNPFQRLEVVPSNMTELVTSDVYPNTTTLD